MRTGTNAVEATKASIGGDGLRIREELPRLIGRGCETLTNAEKDLLKWIGVFFRKPTPGKFMMRVRMPNGFTSSRQLRAIADLSRRLGRFRAATAGKGNDPPAQKLHAFHMNDVAAQRGH